MTWAFDVTSNIPRITQSGTDANLDGMMTAINGVATVARSTAYTTAQLIKPPTPTGFWYRCSTAGTTAATAPAYGTTLAGTTTDGTAVFTAFRAPDARWQGAGYLFSMPDVRVNVTGTLTNSNPQIASFICWDLLLSAAGSNFTSGTWAADGVTPLYDGVHFTGVRESTNASDNSSGGFQLQLGQCTFIGGEVQVCGAIGIAAGTTLRSYYTRWRSTKQWSGVTTTRIRAYSTAAIFRECEFYAVAYDLFRMPAEFSVKARKSEYVAQYAGAAYGGVDAYFKASALENADGSFDFDNYGGGYVELFNCAKGANLNVTSQLPSPKHCVPLYQDVVITAKNTTGAAVQDVRFTATDAPTNSPTITITTAGNLKTWDFTAPLTYQVTTNASGIANTSPVLKVWYYQTSLKQNLRFPASTVTYEGRAYNYKTTTVSVVLGSNTAQSVSAGMVALDAATTVTEAVAGAMTKFTFAPAGATGGTVTATADFTVNELWNYYRWWISQFANRASTDSWTISGTKLTMGAWALVVNSGVTGSAPTGATLNYVYAPTITNNGTLKFLYESSVGPSSILTLKNVSPTGAAAIWHPTTTATELLQTNATGAAADFTLYYPPGSVGLVKNYARELYGSQRVAGSITLAAGLNTVTFVDISDVGITNASASAVAAYTAIESPSKRYDRTAVFRLTEQGIKLGQIAVRSGTSIEGAFSVVVRDDAPAVYSVLGSVITIKAASYGADSKFIKEIVTGGGTFTAFDTELIGIDVEDANGDSSASVQGTVGGLVDVWKCVNGTINADYATGTKIASNISAGKFRFTGTDGFKLIFYDKNSLLARDCSMSKGNYVLGWYVYDAPTGGLTQSQNADFATMVSKVGDIFADVNSVTTGFVETTDNLHALRVAVDGVPAATATGVWTAAERTLTSAGSSGATLAEIEASTVLAKQATVEDNHTTSVAIYNMVENLPPLASIESSTVLAKQDAVLAIGAPLQAIEYLAPANADIASIKATVEAIEPVDLSGIPAAVWANATRTLTETPGLPTTQAEQLRKMAQLHGIGAELVVTETARTAGDVSQTITTTDEQTTVSAA